LKNRRSIEFHENLTSGSRVVPCRRADMTKLIVAFHNFVNMPKNEAKLPMCIIKHHVMKMHGVTYLSAFIT